MFKSSAYAVQSRIESGWYDRSIHETQEEAMMVFDLLVARALPGEHDGRLRVIRRTVDEETVASVDVTFVGLRRVNDSRGPS